MDIRTSWGLIVAGGLAMILAGCGTAPKPPLPAPVAAAPAPAPPPPPTYVIQDVHFDFDRSELKPSAVATLDQVAADLRQHGTVRYEVAGFTDSIGSEAYNQSLSERRAESVRAYLVSRGVDSMQLSARGYGESSPVASNATAEGRARNRRVEVRPIQ
jgi:OmpA-OmpF porin, OOP family